MGAGAHPRRIREAGRSPPPPLDGVHPCAGSHPEEGPRRGVPGGEGLRCAQSRDLRPIAATPLGSAGDVVSRTGGIAALNTPANGLHPSSGCVPGGGLIAGSIPGMTARSWSIRTPEPHVVKVQHAIHSARVRITIDGETCFPGPAKRRRFRRHAFAANSRSTNRHPRRLRPRSPVLAVVCSHLNRVARISGESTIRTATAPSRTVWTAGDAGDFCGLPVAELTVTFHQVCRSCELQRAIREAGHRSSSRAGHSHFPSSRFEAERSNVQSKYTNSFALSSSRQ